MISVLAGMISLTFSVIDLRLGIEVGVDELDLSRPFLEALGDGVGKSAGGVVRAVQDVDNTVTSFLT